MSPPKHRPERRTVPSPGPLPPEGYVVRNNQCRSHTKQKELFLGGQDKKLETLVKNIEMFSLPSPLQFYKKNSGKLSDAKKSA